MKIKTKDISYEKFLSLPFEKREKPLKPSIIFRTLLKIVSGGELKTVHFKCNKIGIEKLGDKEPALFLMNHSAFIDLKSLPQFFILAHLTLFVLKMGLLERSG